MRSNVRDFIASFKKELARPNRFDVFIPIPLVMAPFFSNMNEQFSLRCEMTEMPGRTFATTERKIGSVPIQKFPYQSVYNDLQMTFIVSGDMKEKLFFDEWMELINPSIHYNFRYKVDYCIDIGITQYDMQNNETYRAVLIDAFPLAVSQLDLDWSSDGYHKLSVVFAYSQWQLGKVGDIASNAGIQAIESFVGG